MLSKEHLAIASVPGQQWGPLYEKDAALRIGTIFQELNLPFFAADGKESEDAGPEADCGTKMRCQAECGVPEDQEGLFLTICQVSFVLDDLRLYMDTHPQDQEGLKLLRCAAAGRKRLLGEFARRYYPLTPDCMADSYEAHPETDCYCWEKGPLPWEGAWE